MEEFADAGRIVLAGGRRTFLEPEVALLKSCCVVGGAYRDPKLFTKIRQIF